MKTLRPPPADPPTVDVRDKFTLARRELTEVLIEREEEVDLVLTALIAGEHVLLVGLPGCGKSLLLDSVLRWTGGTKFSLLLTRFTTPEEVFGPVSLAALKADKYVRVADDIRDHGQTDDIVLFGGLVLDGRNRLRACEMAGVEPRVVQYTGDDPTAFVVSKNLNRRHLSDSQRATVAARLANMKQHSNQHTAKSGGPDLGHHTPPVSIDKAAEMLNVSTGNVNKAKQVLRDGSPELVQAVESGEVTLNAAEMLVKLPAEQQAEVVKSGPEAARKKATEVRNGRSKSKQQPEGQEVPEQQPESPADGDGEQAPLKRSKAVEMAYEAINLLKRIPKADERRGEAFGIVAQFIKHNR